MSERPVHPLSHLDLLRQADALLAWVLLGWLGERLGWSVASGVLPVVVWWAVRCSGSGWSTWSTGMQLPLPKVWPKLWPVAVTVALLSSLAWLPTGSGALLVLLLSAVTWGLWSASLAAAAGINRPTLPAHAMGLMMGGLWLSSQWCLGPVWTDVQAVALHLSLMVGVPLLLLAWRRMGPSEGFVGMGRPGWMTHPTRMARSVNSLRGSDLRTTLLAAGALLMAWPDAGSTGRIAGMVLLVLAWALSSRHATDADTHRHAAPHFLPLPAALGPALLLAVGIGAPTLGPVAMQSAWWIIATLALASLVRWRPGTRTGTGARRPELPTQRWSDIS